MFLDGTHNELPLGRNRADIQGKEALISIDANTYKIVKIPEDPAESNLTTDSTVLNIGEYKVTGSVNLRYKGHNAWEIRNYLSGNERKEEKDKLVRSLTGRGSNKYQQTRYDIVPENTKDKDVHIAADFTIDDYAQKVGRECYINMNLKKDFEDRHIDTKDRSVPVYNKYKEKRKEVVVLQVPKGYRVSHVPGDAKGNVDGLGGYKISYKSDGKKVVLTKEFEVSTLSIPSKKFAENNKMIEDLKKAYKESVVLSAI